MKLGILLALVVALVSGLIVILAPHTHKHGHFYEDANNVKQMVIIALHAKTVHALPDGRIDLLRTVFSEIELTEENASILFDCRAEVGPTEKEIAAGDYSSVRREWARVADLQREGRRTPLIWDPVPDDGHVLVGFSDGSVRILTEGEFAKEKAQ